MTAVATDFERAQIAYSGKIRTFSRKTFRFIPGYELADLEAEMLEVLWKCVRAYDPNKGAGFNTLFWRSAHRRLISIRRFYGAQKRGAEWYQLDNDALIRVLDEVVQEFSAEDWYLAIHSVRISSDIL